MYGMLNQTSHTNRVEKTEEFPEDHQREVHCLDLTRLKSVRHLKMQTEAFRDLC